MEGQLLLKVVTSSASPGNAFAALSSKIISTWTRNYDISKYEKNNKLVYEKHKNKYTHIWTKKKLDEVLAEKC